MLVGGYWPMSELRLLLLKIFSKDNTFALFCKSLTGQWGALAPPLATLLVRGVAETES